MTGVRVEVAQTHQNYCAVLLEKCRRCDDRTHQEIVAEVVIDYESDGRPRSAVYWQPPDSEEHARMMIVRDVDRPHVRRRSPRCFRLTGYECGPHRYYYVED